MYGNLALVGIDPGKNGAIAAYSSNNSLEILRLDRATDAYIIDFLNFVGPGIAYIEDVSSSPQMGVKSAFSFGHEVGKLAMACTAAALVIEKVRPLKWQSVLKLKRVGGGYGKNDTAKKRRNRGRAEELFPNVKMHNNIADALLILEYARLAERKPRFDIRYIGEEYVK